jgi:glycolate oxidase
VATIAPAVLDDLACAGDVVVDPDGTITGEHGVGALKRAMLPGELGESLALHRRIKALFEPDNLLNPGKVLELDP